jgi:hypothetical protein
VNREDTRWRYSSKYKTITCSGTRYNYVDRYGSGESINTFFRSLGYHKGIIITFNLAFIDSCDGEPSMYMPMVPMFMVSSTASKLNHSLKLAKATAGLMPIQMSVLDSTTLGVPSPL